MMNEDLNVNLYSTELFEQWTTRKDLNPTENYFLNKYLTDTSKNVLEAGTGGGIISFEIEKKGFSNIQAFDIVTSMITCAKEKAIQKESKIIFSVSDASFLDEYKTNQFDYLVYLQQILCFVPEHNFLEALHESYRVAKINGIVIFSFLDYDSRSFNSILSLIVNFLRKIRGEKVLKYYLPWLKIGEKFNWKIFHKNQAQIFWIKRDYILNKLQELGFEILEIKNDFEIENQKNTARGMLYIICKK